VQIGSAVLSGGIASLTTSTTALNAGSHSITASYGGDTDFTGSNSSPLSQIANSAATTTTMASNLNPVVAGQTVTFTATVSSSLSGAQSGAVDFYLDGSTTPAQSSSVSGNTATFSTSSLGAGDHTVSEAFVSSNPNFAGSSDEIDAIGRGLFYLGFADIANNLSCAFGNVCAYIDTRERLHSKHFSLLQRQRQPIQRAACRQVRSR
jgi:hypothetical protein